MPHSTEEKKARDRARYHATKHLLTPEAKSLVYTAVRLRKAKDPDKYRKMNTDTMRRFRNRDREWKRMDERLRRRGITLDQFHARYESQDFCCAICGKYLDLNITNGIHVDHDHATRKHRGLLCGGCNIGLGAFRDDSSALRSAAAYLER